jgi:hypothetical protein
MQVAEALDTYVQPRFEILRDKNFGAIRIVYRRHAGLVQLKVDSEQEKQIIANVNATKRDYAISLLHCAAPPNRGVPSKPRLELLYANRQLVASDNTYGIRSKMAEADLPRDLPLEATKEKAAKVLPQLLAGKEYRASQPHWDVLMRPVLASNKACVGCHENAKLGDTLGVMVYHVRKTPGRGKSPDIREVLNSLETPNRKLGAQHFGYLLAN